MKRVPSPEVVIWMNQPSHYQTVFFRELARKQIDLRVFYATDVAQERRALGWGEPDSESFSQCKLRGPWDALKKAWHTRGAVHVINGLWSVPLFMLSSTLLLTFHARVYFHAECPNPAAQRNGIWLRVKRLWTKLLFIRAAGLFAIGNRAVGYYQDMGVPKERITRFMYFNMPVPVEGEREGSKFAVIYVGQFVERKRVGDLIEAFARWARDRSDVRLRLIGSGPLKEAYLKQALAAGLVGRIEVLGPLPPKEVVQAIQRSHVLVLPSEFDGWGLTVNEALQAGIPAICSDGCGVAEILIENPGWGLVYPKGNVSALASALGEMASDYARFMPQPAQVARRIGPESLTDLFIATTMLRR